MPDGPPATTTRSLPSATRWAPSCGECHGQLGGRAQQHIGRLEWLDPADEGQHLLVGVQSERSAGGALVTGREHLQVDTGMDHVDPGRVGVVQRNQLLRFMFGVHDQSVGLVDHLLLADGAQRRLG